MAKRLSAGKLRGLTTLADGRGVFKMVATDQRPPIFHAVARHGNRSIDEIRYEEVAAVKRSLVKVLAPEASAVLVDPVWGHPAALTDVPGRTGLLSTLEGYDFEVRQGERYSRPIRDWSVAKIKRSGVQAVKVLAWYRHDARDETREHQMRFVHEVGDACRAHDLPFVLEVLIYPLAGEEPGSRAYAAAKPARVLEAVRTFTDERYGVDLLKLEFPADLKHTAEFAAGAFDGRRREATYDLAEVRHHLAVLHELTHVPWVLLSAGVGPREFAVDLELAFAAGACGFLAGRAVWADALDAYPDMEALEERLHDRSVPYLRQIGGLADTAPPWTAHPAFGGEVQLAGAGEGWAAGYGAR